MNWKKRFYEFIAEWMRSQGYDAQEVLSVYEEAWEDRTGCPTCGGGMEYNIDVAWIDGKGVRQNTSFQNQLSDLFW